LRKIFNEERLKKGNPHGGLNLCNKKARDKKEFLRNSIFFSVKINHKDVDIIKIFIPEWNVIAWVGFELQRFNTYGVEKKSFCIIHDFNEKVRVKAIPIGD